MYTTCIHMHTTCMFKHVYCKYTCIYIYMYKAGHPGVPSYLFVCLGYGWVGYFTFLFLSYFFELVCYAHVFPCSTFTCITCGVRVLTPYMLKVGPETECTCTMYIDAYLY